jgi:hypothetical protein
MTLVKSLIRRGALQTMPILDVGELGLATDENRVFVGTQPIEGNPDLSNASSDFIDVEFSVKVNGEDTPLDLDNANINTFGFYINDDVISPVAPVTNSNFTITDNVVRIVHNLMDTTDPNNPVPRTPNSEDTFTLKLNKEITNNTEEGNRNGVQYTTFTNSTNTVEPVPGVSFNSTVKTSVTVNYYLHSALGLRRSGKLEIFVGENDSHITDNYTSNMTSSVDFSLAVDSTGYKYTLMQKTADTTEHQLSFEQTSFLKQPY